MGLFAHWVLCWTSPAVILAWACLLELHPGLAFQLGKVQAIASRAWEVSTLNTYGAGLGHWAEWCDVNKVPEEKWLPIDKTHLACFIADAAGSISASSFDNWLNGLRAWHGYHDVPWCGDNEFVQLTLKGARKLAPCLSTRDPRPPVLIAHLNAIYDIMDFQNSYDAACWAVVCTAFWGLARLGEITVTSLKPIDPTQNVQRKALLTWNEDFGVKSITVRLPWTKTSQWGTNLILTYEEELSCPFRALQQHLSTNRDLPDEAPLFAFRTLEGWELMVKQVLMHQLHGIWTTKGLLLPSGHSFHIGGTTHLLGRGTNPQMVQKLGHWSSDAFYLYWRNTQLIIPEHVHKAAVERIEAGMVGYFDEVSGEARKRWQEIQWAQKRRKEHRAE
ncbi:hypothetical protein BS47DRAFT_1367998 [Hydnum rufescens UP504]|uniref:Tyr recombinase domain-containing protein n=1 Tax=Hydnum rufescens UP504 TaxID=1448309 RepID=A0A9P6AGZ7_9AGAM|nr:hypothetical protein BS47DRAFT_1367998 [Hydnum rufescens UP504]